MNENYTFLSHAGAKNTYFPNFFKETTKEKQDFINLIKMCSKMVYVDPEYLLYICAG